jgi:hypothetical protein
MKAIPQAIAKSLADTMANIENTTLEMTHTFYDSYDDDRNLNFLTKREFKLHTFYKGGTLKVSFHIVESTPMYKVERLNIDNIDSIIAEEQFTVTAEGITATFPIESSEEDNTVDDNGGNDSEDTGTDG